MAEKITRKQQAENTRNNLIDISFKLIEKYGYDSVTIQQICKEADVSVGAFYHHFGSKAGIIKAGYSRCDEYFENVISSKISGSTYCEKINQYIGYQMEYAEGLGIDLMIQIYRAQITEGNEFFLSPERALPKGLYGLIEHGQKAGELSKEYSYSEIGSEILIISRGIIYNWCQCEGSYPLHEKAGKIIPAYLKYYQL